MLDTGTPNRATDGPEGTAVLEPRNPREEAFRREALPHLDAVYRFALRLAGTEGDAEDLVQETFLRAYRSWDQYTEDTNCKSWLFTICRNVFLQGRERSQRREELLTQEAGEDPGNRSREIPLLVEGAEWDPEGRFFDSLLDEAILAAIDELPEKFRTAVILSDLEDLSYDEAAEVIGVPVGTLKSRLFRGRRLLQRQLFDYAVESGFLRPEGPEQPHTSQEPEGGTR